MSEREVERERTNLLVEGSIVLLEIHSELQVISQRLVNPWNFLICIEQMPAVVAHGQPSHISPDVASGVSTLEDAFSRLRLTSRGKAYDLARWEIFESAFALPKGVGRH